MDENEKYRAGLAVRREVLGSKYVDQSLAKADDFTAPLQQFLTENAWGAVWTREGLSRHTRSMITLAMLVALNRGAELRLHIRGALRNGVTQDELRELFLHSGVYCGAPAALDAFKQAQQVFAELAAEGAA